MSRLRDPDFGTARTYTIYGSDDLAIWQPVTDTAHTSNRFFKVSVGLP